VRKAFHLELCFGGVIFIPALSELGEIGCFRVVETFGLDSPRKGPWAQAGSRDEGAR